ncbi:MAG: hypothetical protein JSV81_15110 [Anaerolineales bacterium]|nr:MAG: hypothetical protein JSV81_15110 [Anaerolineales bacterium]
MSKSAQLFLVTALAYLGLGLILHAIAMFDIWLGFNPLAYTSVGATMQALLIGWLTQSVMALLYQLLVKSPRMVTMVWACLNVGLVLTIVGQPVLALTGNDLVGGLVAMGGLMQVAGGMTFAIELVQALRK